MKEFLEEAQDKGLRVKEFLDTRYKDYAKYVLYSRAIPSVVDGFKPSQRKVIYTAIREARTSIKTAALSGFTVAKSNYHHGEGSISGAVSLLAASWNNNVPLFESESNMGSRMVKEAAAPRYTFVKLSREFERYFTDFDILEPTDDPEDPEPRFYLPLIPWVLVNGVKGTAIGYATNIQPRDPKVLSRLCHGLMSGKLTEQQVIQDPLVPYFEGFQGAVFRNLEGQYVCRGAFKRTSPTQIEIIDIPVTYDRETYVSKLDALEERGHIASYTDLGRMRFQVRLPNSSKDISDKELYRYLKIEVILSENITTIDEHGRLKVFNSPGELLVHFVRYRLSRYPIRFQAWKRRDSERLGVTQETLRFIKAVVNGDIILKDKNKSALIECLREMSFSESVHPTLLNLRTYQFCDDEIEKLEEQERFLLSSLETWESAVPEEWYLKELEDIQ